MLLLLQLLLLFRRIAIGIVLISISFACKVFLGSGAQAVSFSVALVGGCGCFWLAEWEGRGRSAAVNERRVH